MNEFIVDWRTRLKCSLIFDSTSNPKNKCRIHRSQMSYYYNILETYNQQMKNDPASVIKVRKIQVLLCKWFAVKDQAHIIRSKINKIGIFEKLSLCHVLAERKRGENKCIN